MNRFVEAFKNRRWQEAKPVFIGGEGRPSFVVDMIEKKVYYQQGDELVPVDPNEIANLFPSDIIAELTGKEPVSPAIDLEDRHRPPDLPDTVIVEAERVAQQVSRQRRKRRAEAVED